MAGYVASGAPPRVRIKGRTWSVLRFFTIALSFMLLWVLITSQLGYYARWFGPSILLALSLAFNLPAIPVLIFAGQVEKLLDARVGPITSMAVRLNFGLVGCTLCAAAFPFVATTYTRLMVIVAVLGMASAIAFSTAYQLAQWFRHADIIALGIGGVGTGPLVLLIELSMHVGPHPERWQWLAMFELTAAIMFLGILSSSSLFTQYWKIMAGEEEYREGSKHAPTQPLLPTSAAAEPEEEEAAAQQQDERAKRLVRATTQRNLLPPDPTAFAVAAVLTPGEFTWPDEDDRGVPCLQRASTFTPASRSWADLVVAPTQPTSLPTSSGGGASSTHGSRRGGPMSRTHSAGHKLGELKRAPHAQHSSQQLAPPGSQAVWPRPAAAGSHEGSGHGAWKPPLDVIPSESLMQRDVSTLQAAGAQTEGSAQGPPHGAAWQAGASEAGDAAHTAEHQQQQPLLRQAVPRAHTSEAGSDVPMTLQQENMAVMARTWRVMLAFTVSVIITYIVFPFFTYVPSSGLIKEELPKVLFFARIFADIVGRFAPRKKALMVHSQSLLLSIALFKLVLAVLFFLYIKAPQRLQHDMVALVLVILIWVIGGYINTSANILGPSLVTPQLAGRASALLALLFQVAHFAGLVLAVGLAFLLFGDIVG